MKNLALKLLAIAVLTIFVAFFTFCGRMQIRVGLPQKIGVAAENERTDEPIRPIPIEITQNPDKVALGERLFNDTQLSRDNTISCASCHNLLIGGTDRRIHSVGIDRLAGSVNAPTVFNATFNFKQFWDGRAEDLETQIDGPIHASNELGSNWEEITDKLRKSPQYTDDFARIYNTDIRPENIKDAIATFERTLTTPNSRFDQFLRGDQNAITAEEKEGYRTFKSVGCISCHQGVNIGGNLFEEFGVMGDYFNDRGNITKADLGRYNVTQREFDKYVFKVPSLRNISKTYPYFHDGSAKTLEEAVSVMSKYQLGRRLSAGEIASIVRFLRTLDGEYRRPGN